MPLWSLCKAWVEVVIASRDKGAQERGPCSGHSILDQRVGVGCQLEGKKRMLVTSGHDCPLSGLGKVPKCQQGVWPATEA